MSEPQSPAETKPEHAQVADVLDDRLAERRKRWDKTIIFSSGFALAGGLTSIASWFVPTPDSATIIKGLGRAAGLLGLSGVVAGHLGRHFDKPARAK